MSAPLRLDLLETELVLLILEFVADTSPHTLKAVALTSRFFYQTTRLIAHRHSELNIEGTYGLKQLPTKLERFLQDSEFLVHVRTLTVNGSLNHYPRLQKLLDNADLWEPIVELISRIGKLKRLTWNLPSIPTTVIEALHTHQSSANLRLFKFCPSPDPFPSAVDKALANSAALTHLRSLLITSPTYSVDVLDFAVQRIIARAPLEYAGVVRRSAHTELSDSDMEMLNRKFLTHGKANSTLKSLTLDGYEISEGLMKEWSSIIDLTRLERVKFTRGLPSLGYFSKAASMLPNLRHVSLNLARVRRSNSALLTVIQDYLRYCPALESLSLWSWIDIINLDDILKQHASSLRSLQLHEREESGSSRPRKLLTPNQVQDIITSCKKLKDLTFDLNRSSSALGWAEDSVNLPYFKILADARLDHVQIYYDVGLAYMVETRNAGRYWNAFLGIVEDEEVLEDDFTDEDEDDEDEDDENENDENGNEDEDEDDEEEGTENDDTNHTENLVVAQNQDSNEVVNEVTTGATNEAASAVEHPGSNNQHKSRGSSPSLSEPSSKRAKVIENIAPSPQECMEQYAKNIWKVLFANSRSAGRLEIKFGEWERTTSPVGIDGESYPVLNVDEERSIRRLIVRRSERDDQRDQCTVRVESVLKDFHPLVNQ